MTCETARWFVVTTLAVGMLIRWSLIVLMRVKRPDVAVEPWIGNIAQILVDWGHHSSWSHIFYGVVIGVSVLVASRVADLFVVFRRIWFLLGDNLVVIGRVSGTVGTGGTAVAGQWGD
jgi:hypothetical protein